MTSSTMRPPAAGYHHGDLPAVLRRATAELVHERGPAGFSLREVARRAGVSHAAPAHHFGDRRGLLTAVAIEAFEHLHAAFVEAAAGIDDAAERLRRQSIAYVLIGRQFPGHCAVVFRADLVDATSVDYQRWGAAAYGQLVETVELVAEQYNPQLDVDIAARLCWSAMHGLVELFGNLMAPDPNRGDHPTRTTSTIEVLADRFTVMILTGMTQRNLRPPH